MKNNTTTTPDNADYKNLVDCMAVFSEASARMGELENDLQQCWLELVDARRRDYTTLQSTLTRAEEAIRCSAELHPEWFEKVRSVKTPYGTVAFRKVKKLEVPNEEVSIVLLEQLGQDGLPFIVAQKKLNLEALEKLSDAELKRLRIHRYTTDSCRITPAKVDLGKAVAATVAAATEATN